MALQKSKTILRPDGTISTGNYWKITKIEMDKVKLEVIFTISLFVDKTKADSGLKGMGPVYKFTDTFTKSELSGNLTALGYAFIKSSLEGDPPSVFSIGLNRQAWVDLQGATDV